MTTLNGWLQILVYFIALVLLVRPLASVSQRLTLAPNTATWTISQVATPATAPARVYS